MKKISCLVLFILLTSCGLGNDSSETFPVNVAELNFETDDNGCIISHNAEASPEYLIGDKQAKNFIWNCLEDDWEYFYQERYEVYTLYDYAHQCYRQHWSFQGDGNCGVRATAPDTPLFSVNIVDISGGTPHPMGGMRYLVDFSVSIENTGNVSVFNLRGKLYFNEYSLEGISVYEPDFPGETVTIGHTALFYGPPGLNLEDSYTLLGELWVEGNDFILDSTSVLVPIK